MSALHIKLLKAFKGQQNKSRAFKAGCFGAHDKKGLSKNNCYCPNECTSCDYDAGYKHYNKVNNILHNFLTNNRATCQ